MENENREYILRVYGALQEKGYNAVGQIVGWWHIGQDHLNLKLKTHLQRKSIHLTKIKA